MLVRAIRAARSRKGDDVTALASWTFRCDICPAHAVVAGTDLKEAENTLVSVLRWRSLGNWRHSCEAHDASADPKASVG
jgi:hypothetical protein